MRTDEFGTLHLWVYYLYALKLPVDFLPWSWPGSLIGLFADAVGFLVVNGMLAMGVGIVAMTIVWRLLRVLPSSTVTTPLVPALSGPGLRERSSALLSWGLAVLISVLAIIGAIILYVAGWALWVWPWQLLAHWLS